MWCRTDEPIKRPAEYCAPSWSWASVPASSEFYFVEFAMLAPQFSIIDCRTVPVHSSAPFGPV